MKGLFPTLLLITLFTVFQFTPGTVASQSRVGSVPAWVLYETAERHFRNREFSLALEMYGEALSVQPVFPEAMAGMARVHRAAGDTTLSKRYFLRALGDAHHLIIPDQEYALRLELARLYELSGTEQDMRNRQEQLEAIVARDPIFSRTEDPQRRDAMVDLLYRNGLNRVLVLYRLDFPQSLEAHRRLGQLLLDARSPDDREQAVEHLLFAVVEIAGRAVEALIDIQFDFTFTSVENLLATASRHPDVLRYLENSRFLPVLRDLADALEAAPDNRGLQQAREIRRVLP